MGRQAVALRRARAPGAVAAVRGLLMDTKSRALLEFPVIRARLADYAGFGPSRRLAEQLEPSNDPIVVARGLDETDQARSFLSERSDVGIGGARDIGPAVGRAARGGRLDPSELLDVLGTLVAAGRLADALREEQRPLLHELSRRIATLPTLRNRLELSLDPAGELLDSASPALGGLRRAVRIAYERLRARLETLVHGSEVSAALQEPIITLRNGRYVVPVRADAKSKVQGIVHDQSGSGQTLFIEPLVAVELGNAWREAQLKVQAEEERILDELSALVASQAGKLRETLDALALFDFWACKARLAGELDGVRAETTPAEELTLLSARHPGLSGRVVPIDIRLGGDYTALVITGPNTGGKTVALRTVGLLSLMHQAGLHVPAAPGQPPADLPRRLRRHRRRAVRGAVALHVQRAPALDRAHRRAGRARAAWCCWTSWARARIRPRARRWPRRSSTTSSARALVVATTHYAELKTYAHNTPQARNASVEFDLETLSPTYRLTIGLPGTSQAFAIAERLGLPAELVNEARSRLSTRPAGLRGDARVDQGVAADDRRGRDPRGGRRRAGDGGAPPGRGGTAPGPPRTTGGHGRRTVRGGGRRRAGPRGDRGRAAVADARDADRDAPRGADASPGGTADGDHRPGVGAAGGAGVGGRA